MHIAEIRQAASTRPRENWAVETGELLKRLPPPKEDPGLFSDSIPSRTLKGPVNRKKTIHLGDIMHDLGDTNDNLLTKLLLYSKKDLPTAEELCPDFEKLRRFPTERFARLEVPVFKFQQTYAYTPHILRCTMNSHFRNHGPRNDWVWIVAGTKDQYGALRGRLPAILRCLFKLRNPYSGTALRLALVQILHAQPGAGRLQDDSCLVKVTEKRPRDNRDERVVGIDCIMGMAHLIPDIDVPGQYWVNSRIDLETFNEIY